MTDTSFEDVSDTKFVGSKILKIQSENLVDYNPDTQNQIKFHFPKSLNFIDFSKSKMRFQLEMSGRGNAVPDQSAHSLFRDVRVMTEDNIQIERIDDYNAAVQLWYESGANSTLENLRDLFEGRSVNSDVNNQLYYGSFGDWTTGAVSSSAERKKVKIQMPVHTGILSGKTYPVVATGLRTEMNLDKQGRSLRYNSSLWEQNEPVANRILTSSVGGAKAPGDDPKTTTGESFTIQVVHTTRADMLLDIADPLYINNGTDEELLGIITSFSANGGELVISYIPDRTNGVGLTNTYAHTTSYVYYKKADRLNGYTATKVPAAQVTASGTKTSYNISNIEWSLLQVFPPQKYVSSMVKAISREKGIDIDFPSWSLYKTNQTPVQGINDQIIPCTQRRVLSTFSLPLDLAVQNDLCASSLKGVLDDATEFQLSYANKLYPTRPLILRGLNNGKNQPFAEHELKKAIENAQYSVKNMLNLDERFSFSRAWTKQGQIKDLSDDTLSLRVDYGPAVAKNKLFLHFIRHLSRMNISKMGVRVIN